MLRSAIAAALLAAAASFAPIGSSYAATVLKINESLGPGSAEEYALKAFQKIVEEKSNQELTIQIHLLDALGNPTVSLESLTIGSLDLYSGALEYYAPIAGEHINILSLPFLLKSPEQLRNYLRSDLFKPAIDKLAANGIRFLSTEFNGTRGPYRVLVSSKRVATPDDLVGLKVRMFPNAVYQRAWAALGTVPIQLAFNETYLAIRQGTVDAVTTGLQTVRSMKFTEVAPYIVAIKEYPQTWPITISEATWAKLSPEQQKILVDAANEATRIYAQTTADRAQDDIAFMEKTNKAELIEIDPAGLRKKLEPLYDQLVKEGVLSSELLTAVAALPE